MRAAAALARADQLRATSSAVIALYRPGPMSVNMHYDYADRKNGRKPVELLPRRRRGGARRHLRPDDLSGERDARRPEVRRLLAGRGRQPAQGDGQEVARGDGQGAGGVRGRCRAPPATARLLGKQLFDVIEKFADYAFNKSHTFGYGLVTYQTAYLKAHYPVEYFACLLTSVKSNLDKAAVYLSDCRCDGHQGADARRQPFGQRLRRGRRPTRSPTDVALAVGQPGRDHVRAVGGPQRRRGPRRAAARRARRQRPVRQSFHDFAERVPEPVLNKRTVESLIKAGAFDSLGHPRRGLLMVFEQIIDATLVRRRERDQGVMSLFGDCGDGDERRRRVRRARRDPRHEFDKSDRLRFEKEMLGLYVSDHPLLGVEAALRRKVDCGDRRGCRDARTAPVLVLGGVITNLARKFTKKGDQMAVFVLEDLDSDDRGHGLPAHADGAGPQARRRRRSSPSRVASTARRVTGRLHGRRSPSSTGSTTVRRRRCGSRLPATSLNELNIHQPEADPARAPRRLAGLARHRPGQDAAPGRRVPRRPRSGRSVSCGWPSATTP